MVSCDAAGHHPFLFLPSGVQLALAASSTLSHHLREISKNADSFDSPAMR